MAEVEIERRRAHRHLVQIPLRIRATGRTLSASTLNVSRAGVLIRLSIGQLGLEPHEDPAEVMQDVSDLLGDLIVADFDPDQLGSLVCKSLRPVRIAVPEAQSGAIEVGCALREELSEQELIVLGLPPHAEDESVPLEEVHAEDAPDAELQALVCGSDGRPARPLFGEVRSVTGGGVRLVIPPDAREGLLPMRATVSNVLGNLRVRYGSRPMLVILRGGRPIWAVAARVEEAIVRRRSGRIDLALRFSEAPDEGIRARLGLAGARDLGRAAASPPELGAEVGP